MDFDEDTGASRRRYPTALAPIGDMMEHDDDLLFDIEYEDVDPRRRSASADSFRSCHPRHEFHVDSYDDTGAEPEPEPGDRQGVARVRSFKLRQEEWYGSLPGHNNSSKHRYYLNVLHLSHIC